MATSPGPSEPTSSPKRDIVNAGYLIRRFIVLGAVVVLVLAGLFLALLQVLPTPNQTVTATVAETPTAVFSREIGMNVFPAVTLEDIGAIPAGALVRISTVRFEDGEYIYQIATENDVFADARESQLEVAPGYTLGSPTEAVP